MYFPASSTAGGMAMGMPDVCLTPAPPAPPIPVPYPNLAQMPSAQDASTVVLIENKETVTQICKIPNSSGDEAGVNGGVASGVFVNECGFSAGSSKVFAEGQAVVFLTGQTLHNGSSSNVPGFNLVPSQALVIVAM